jgi:hypothetical protein
MSVTVFAIHEVYDYDVWRAFYDDAEPFRPAGHVISHSVHRLEGSPETLMVVHQFETSEQAHTFWENPELMAIVESSGVTAIPRLEYFLDT